VCAHILAEKAIAHVLGLDAREPALRRHARQHEQPHRPDTGTEIETPRHGHAVLERVPGRQQVVRRVPMSFTALEDSIRRREAIDRNPFPELRLERRATCLECLWGEHQFGTNRKEWTACPLPSGPAALTI